MVRFLEIKSVHTKLRQNQITKKLVYSSSTLQRNRHNRNTMSPHRIPSNTHKRRQKASKELKRPQMTSNDANPMVDSVSEAVAPDKQVKSKNKLKSGGNIE